MNTKKQTQKNPRLRKQQKQSPKKQGHNPITLHENRKIHEQELPELRMTD
jgi:hypothetical protein